MNRFLLFAITLLSACSLGSAKGAVQTPPDCVYPCYLGYTHTNGWIKQTFPTIPPAVTITQGTGISVTGGPAYTISSTVPVVTLQAGTGISVTGGPNPYVITNIAAGGGSGPGIAPITYTGTIVPNTWYGLYDPVPASIPLPQAGSGLFVNPKTIICFSNYGTTATAITGTPAPYGGPSSLTPGAAAACYAVDDKTPAGWRGDGG